MVECDGIVVQVEVVVVEVVVIGGCCGKAGTGGWVGRERRVKRPGDSGEI